MRCASSRSARRPHPGHARQCGGAVGVHAGGDEARRRRRAGDDPSHPQRSRRSSRADACATSLPMPMRCQIRDLPGDYSRSSSARRCRLGFYEAAYQSSANLRRMTIRGRTIQCCSILRPALRRGRNSCCTAIRAIRRPICRRCIGSDCGGRRASQHLVAWLGKHAWSCFFSPWNAQRRSSSSTSGGSTRAAC